MYRKFSVLLLLCNVSLLIAFCFAKIEERNAVRMAGTSQLGCMETADSRQRRIDYSLLMKEPVRFKEPEDGEVLRRIVEAEAGGEDINGKMLVANVILNRVRNKNFPDTISAVVFQSENGMFQFSPVADGRYRKVKVSDETKEAVERVMEGEDISRGALYFVCRKKADPEKMKWFDEHLTLLFTYGGHEFYF